MLFLSGRRSLSEGAGVHRPQGQWVFTGEESILIVWWLFLIWSAGGWCVCACVGVWGPKRGLQTLRTTEVRSNIPVASRTHFSLRNIPC